MLRSTLTWASVHTPSLPPDPLSLSRIPSAPDVPLSVPYLTLCLLPTEQSRRDDLESIGYMLLYFLRGSLPWQGLKATTKRQKYDKILEKKVSTSSEVLCKHFPIEFRTFFEHVRALGFDDRPDYDYLKRLFRDLFFRRGCTYDGIFDWDLLIPGMPPLHHDEDLLLEDGKQEERAKAKEDKAELIARYERRQDIPQVPLDYQTKLMGNQLDDDLGQMSSQLASTSLHGFGVQAHHSSVAQYSTAANNMFLNPITRSAGPTTQAAFFPR